MWVQGLGIRGSEFRGGGVPGALVGKGGWARERTDINMSIILLLEPLTLNPKFQTLHPKLQTLHPKLHL